MDILRVTPLSLSLSSSSCIGLGVINQLYRLLNIPENVSRSKRRVRRQPKAVNFKSAVRLKAREKIS